MPLKDPPLSFNVLDRLSLFLTTLPILYLLHFELRPNCYVLNTKSIQFWMRVMFWKALQGRSFVYPGKKSCGLPMLDRFEIILLSVNLTFDALNRITCRLTIIPAQVKEPPPLNNPAHTNVSLHSSQQVSLTSHWVALTRGIFVCRNLSHAASARNWAPPIT